MLVPFMEICGWFPVGGNMYLGSMFELNPRNKVLHSRYMQNVSVANQIQYHSWYFGGKRNTLGTANVGTA